MTEREDESSAVLSALADSVRRELLDILAVREEATATDIAENLPISRQAVAKHFAVLTNAGLVTSRRQGREVLYSLQPEKVETTARWMANLAAGWDARLQRLKRLAESGETTSRSHVDRPPNPVDDNQAGN
jgi:DNA-binding transcriptional ArsR family regulator